MMYYFAVMCKGICGQGMYGGEWKVREIKGMSGMYAGG